MRYCIFCGVEIPEDAMYCQICGKQQPEDTVSVPEETETKTGVAAWLSSPRNMVIAGVGGFVLVLLIATAVMVVVLGN